MARLKIRKTWRLLTATAGLVLVSNSYEERSFLEGAAVCVPQYIVLKSQIETQML